MDNNIIIQELNGSNWITKSNLDFGFVPVGKDFVSKTIRFSPTKSNIADLKAKVEKNDGFLFTDSENYIINTWKSIGPFKIKMGEYSDPVKVEFLVKSGPARMDYFKLMFSFLEIPCDE